MSLRIAAVAFLSLAGVASSASASDSVLPGKIDLPPVAGGVVDHACNNHDLLPDGLMDCVQVAPGDVAAQMAAYTPALFERGYAPAAPWMSPSGVFQRTLADGKCDIVIINPVDWDRAMTGRDTLVFMFKPGRKCVPAEMPQ